MPKLFLDYIEEHMAVWKGDGLASADDEDRGGRHTSTATQPPKTSSKKIIDRTVVSGT